MKLKLITPYRGDWLVIIDEESEQEVYSGHGYGDELWEVLNYLGVEYSSEEIPDNEFEEKYA